MLAGCKSLLSLAPTAGPSILLQLGNVRRAVAARALGVLRVSLAARAMAAAVAARAMARIPAVAARAMAVARR